MKNIGEHLANTFLQIGTSFNLTNYDMLKQEKSLYILDDKEAIAKDWEAVGKALNVAMQDTEKIIESEYKRK